MILEKKISHLKILVIAIFFFASYSNAGQESAASQFSFVKASKPSSLFVDKPYSSEQGYGFDLNTQINNQGNPFYFSTKVSEGNYRITVEFGHSRRASSNTVKAESRRLFLQDVKTLPGKFTTRSFTANVRNSALADHREDSPTSEKVLLKTTEAGSLNWDDKLTLEFDGAAPQVRSIRIEKVDVPTLFLIGDSTVTDQPYEPAASWGQMLPRFFKDEVAVANHAESGETMKAFIMELRLAKVLETIKKDDYLFIQFGHNDQKQQWQQTYADAETTYKDYLKVLIAEARLRGATPVVITSMQRRNFDQNGKIQNTHGNYPEAVREVAKEMKVALIDLEAMSIKLYEALGPDKAPLAFNDYGKDKTHHNNYGAYELAKCVVQGIRDANLAVASKLLDKLPIYDPANPDPVEIFTLSQIPIKSQTKPAGN
ncbi:MAG: rhamnogalacturonan acetylesterase [Pseudomonadota bacterium]